jgi:hypothetical protein
MKHINLRRLLLKFFILGVYLFGFMVLGVKIEYEDPVLIKDPKPTHVESTYIDLVKVHVISPDIDDNHFMGRPIEMAVDSKGNLIVYDNIVNKTFIFDKDFKFLRSVLSTGQGPGEIRKGISGKHMYLSSDDKIYISDRDNRKMVVLTSSGDYVKDIRLPLFQRKETYPVVDRDNNYYFLAPSSYSDGNLINVLDKEFVKLYSLVDSKEMKRFVVMLPSDGVKYAMVPTSTTVRYDLISNNGLIVYLVQSSTALVYRGDKLVKRFDIHPKLAIELHRRSVKRLKEKIENAYSTIFWNVFVDKDTGGSFYLGSPGDGDNKLLYQFDLNGTLMAVYRTPVKMVNFLAKRHHYFYAVNYNDDHIYVFKEKKNNIK